MIYGDGQLRTEKDYVRGFASAVYLAMCSVRSRAMIILKFFDAFLINMFFFILLLICVVKLFFSISLFSFRLDVCCCILFYRLSSLQQPSDFTVT